MSKFLSYKYKNLKPYTPGEQIQDKRYIKLNTNENPFPPSPKVIEAITSKVLMDLRLYSDPESTKSTQAIADFYNLQKSNVLVTNGSDEALAFVYMTFCDDKREIVAPDISYGFYPVFCELLYLKNNVIPLNDDFSINVNAFCGINKNIIIANPNAPTGMVVSAEEIEKIVSSNPDNIVIIDEAYMDFGNQSAVKLIDYYDNLIIVGTFSKSRSLAGGRLGFILSNSENISDLKKIKYSFNPYSVNSLTDTMGAYAMKDVEYFNQCTSAVIENREFTTQALTSLGFNVLPSQANFIFAKRYGISGEKLYIKLKQKGILVRYFDKPRLRDFIRISIGSKKDMEILIEAIKNILSEEGVL